MGLTEIIIIAVIVFVIALITNGLPNKRKSSSSVTEPQELGVKQQTTTPQTQDNCDKKVIEQLDELFHAGILTEKEYKAEKKRFVPIVDNSDKDTKIVLLRNLKSLQEAEILTIEEFNEQKHDVLSSKAIPIWVKEKTKVEILIELKKLLDEKILSQEEFDAQKKEILNT